MRVTSILHGTKRVRTAALTGVIIAATALSTVVLGTGDAFASNRLPLFRLYNPQNHDHFYTTSTDEAHNAQNLGYTFEGSQGWIDSGYSPGDLPWYRWRNPTTNQHFYTVSSSPVPGWVSEGIAGYLYSTPTSSYMQLYRFYDPQNGDHLYTTNPQEVANQPAYHIEDTEGWVSLGP